MKVVKSVVAALACVFGSMAGQAQQSPADLYGPLLAAVQESRAFPDGKTFVDAVPKRDPAAILADYRRSRTSSNLTSSSERSASSGNMGFTELTFMPVSVPIERLANLRFDH